MKCTDLNLMFMKYRSSHRRCSIKKVFLNISQNSQENTCARVSSLIKFQAEPYNFIKTETLAQVFSFEFCEIFKNTFFTEHLWTNTSKNILTFTDSDASTSTDSVGSSSACCSAFFVEYHNFLSQIQWIQLQENHFIFRYKYQEKLQRFYLPHFAVLYRESSYI